MPHTADTLPSEIQAMPDGARSIWLAAFNSAFKSYEGTTALKEDVAAKVAMAAVKRKYKKQGAKWMTKSAGDVDHDAAPLGAALQHTGKSAGWVVPLMRRKDVSDALFATERIAYAPILVPWQVDTQGDLATPDEIIAAKARFDETLPIGIEHRMWGGVGVVFENAIAGDNDPDFVAGTWYAGIKFTEEAWQHVLDDELSGLSPGSPPDGPPPWKRVPILDDVPGSPCWLTDIDFKELSAVKLAANRGQFARFKSADGGRGTMAKDRGARTAKYGEVGYVESVPYAPTLMIENDMVCYPWSYAVDLLGEAFSLDDAARIASLMLAKWGGTDGGTVMVPVGTDFTAAAKEAIAEGATLVADNPLLRPDGKMAAPNATLAASLKAAILSIFGKDSGTAVEEPPVAVAPLAAVAPPMSVTTSYDPATAAELTKLNANLEALLKQGAATSPAPKVTTLGGDPATPPVGDPPAGDPPVVTEPNADGVPDGEITLKQAIDEIRILGQEVKALQAKAAAVPARPVGSRGVHAEPSAAPATKGTYFSTFLGAELPMSEVEPFLRRKNAGVAQ